MEDGKAVPLPELALVPTVPRSPEAYASIHQNRIAKFGSAEEKILRKPERDPSPWRHELEHDAESVFWLLLYWTMVVQPMQSPTHGECINPGAWANLLGQAPDRNTLVISLALGDPIPGLTDSIYQPLRLLIKNLASILVVDRQWLAESDVRNDPAYISEAFQRLILQFILDHRDQEFMSCEADVKFRSVKPTPQSNAYSATNSEKMLALDRKRPSPQPLIDKGKRRRLDVAQTEVHCQCGFSSGFNVMFCRVLMWEWKTWKTWKTEDSEDGDGSDS